MNLLYLEEVAWTTLLLKCDMILVLSAFKVQMFRSSNFFLRVFRGSLSQAEKYCGTANLCNIIFFCFSNKWQIETVSWQLSLCSRLSKMHLFCLWLFFSMCMAHSGRIWRKVRHGLLWNATLMLVSNIGALCSWRYIYTHSWNSSIKKSINMSKFCFITLGWCRLEKNFVAVSLKFCKNLSENKALTISKHTTGETVMCAVDDSKGIYYYWVNAFQRNSTASCSCIEIDSTVCLLMRIRLWTLEKGKGYGNLCFHWVCGKLCSSATGKPDKDEQLFNGEFQ